MSAPLPRTVLLACYLSIPGETVKAKAISPAKANGSLIELTCCHAATPKKVGSAFTGLSHCTPAHAIVSLRSLANYIEAQVKNDIELAKHPHPASPTGPTGPAHEVTGAVGPAGPAGEAEQDKADPAQGPTHPAELVKDEKARDAKDRSEAGDRGDHDRPDVS
jgi:hypothetical protein